MKILYHHRIRSRDGAYVHISEICRALTERGHEIVVAGPNTVSKSDGYAKGLDVVSIVRKKLPKFLWEIMEITYSLYDFTRLVLFYYRSTPDIIYERYQLFTPTGIWLKYFFRIPLVLEVNSPLAMERSRTEGLFFRTFADRVEAFTWKHADRVLPASEAMASIIVSRTGLPRDKIEIIRNAVTPQAFAPGAHDNAKRSHGLEGRLVIGFIGFLREWHNADRVVRFLHRRGEDLDLHFLIVGDGPARQDVEELARELDVASRLTITGVVPRDEVSRHAAAFDIAVHIHDVEYAIALKLIEYLSLGLPILANDSESIREVLVNDENALLIDEDDPQAYEETLELLCRDVSLRERLGMAARRTIVDQGLTWDENARRVEEVLSDLLTQSGR